MGYGLITFSSMLVSMFGFVNLMPGFYREERWTVGRELLHTFAIVLLVATGNFLFSSYLQFFDFSFRAFVLFVGFTMAVGIFPVLIQVLLRQNIHQKRNLHKSDLLNDRIQNAGLAIPRPEVVQIQNEEGGIELSLDPATIIAFESSDNYVSVFYNQEAKVKARLVRNTLKHFEKQFENDLCFFRCHRSFLVNLRHLQQVNGNARGLVLKLHEDLKPVPVSRSNIDAFTALMEKE